MTNGLVCSMQLHSTSFNDNVLTGSHKQTFICHPDTAYHFPDFRLGLHPQCCIQSLLFFSVSITQLVWVVMQWVDEARGQGCWGPVKYLNWFLTLILMKQECQATSVQLREVLKVYQGCSNLNNTACLQEDASENGPGEQTHQPVTLKWTHPSWPQSSVVCTYTGDPRGKKDNEVSHINDGASPLSIFLLYFAEIITLLEMEINCYYHDYIDRLDNGPSPEHDVTEAKMFVLLALTLQKGPGVRDKLTDYWQQWNSYHIFLWHYD